MNDNYFGSDLLEAAHQLIRMGLLGDTGAIPTMAGLAQNRLDTYKRNALSKAPWITSDTRVLLCLHCYTTVVQDSSSEGYGHRCESVVD